LKPSRDIDVIAEYVVVLNDYVAKIDADPEPHIRSGSSLWFRSASWRWISTAVCTAITELGNSANKLSPAVLTIRPRCWEITSAMMRL
jgi:hypothetical protein